MRRFLSKTDSRVIMNSFSKVFAFACAVLIIASLVMVPAAKVNADSNEPLVFSSGLTLYSPVNATYGYSVLECNGTFVGPSEYEVSLNYSIDGNYQGYLPWALNQNSSSLSSYTLDWSFQLPHLANGPHQLSIGIEKQLYNSNATLISQSTLVNTVYLTISPSFQPIPSALEFSLLAVVLLILTAILILVYLRHRKPRAKQIVSPTISAPQTNTKLIPLFARYTQILLVLGVTNRKMKMTLFLLAFYALIFRKTCGVFPI